MSADATRGERMTKEQLTKEDGRYVLLYSFTSDSPVTEPRTPGAHTQDSKPEAPRV